MLRVCAIDHTSSPPLRSVPPLRVARAAVIFLKSTHAELIRAGYTNLDPHHKLFLQYRPERVDEDETIPDASAFNATKSIGPCVRVFSPRNNVFSPQNSPRNSPWLDVTETYLEVGTEAVLQVRRGASLTSKRAGVLRKGTKLRVLDSRVWREDGTQRLRVTSAEPESDSSSLSSWLPMGWISAIPGFFSGQTAPANPAHQTPAWWQNEMEC